MSSVQDRDSRYTGKQRAQAEPKATHEERTVTGLLPTRIHTQAARIDHPFSEWANLPHRTENTAQAAPEQAGSPNTGRAETARSQDPDLW